jgi:hypothetical protein
MKHLSSFIGLVLFTALACNSAQIGQQLAPSGGILYQDRFSDPQSGWGQLNGEAGLAGYTEGAYYFYVKSPNVNLWAHPGMDFDTVRLEVDAMTANGPQENRIGLICRLRDDANFYYFIISADGYYGIGKVKDGQWSLLNADQMQQHDAIHGGSQVNHIRADCVSSLLILYVNDQLVGSAQDSDFTGGDVGLLAGAFDLPDAEIYFDNFMVFKP